MMLTLGKMYLKMCCLGYQLVTCCTNEFDVKSNIIHFSCSKTSHYIYLNCTKIRHSEILTCTIVFCVDYLLEDGRKRPKHVGGLPLLYFSLLNPP
jgi:hypothetical protein